MIGRGLERRQKVHRKNSTAIRCCKEGEHQTNCFGGGLSPAEVPAAAGSVCRRKVLAVGCTLGSPKFLSLQEKEERYFLLFSNVLLMLSASPRMSGFIYQVGELNLKLQGVRCEKENQIGLTKFKSSASLNLAVVLRVSEAGNQDWVLPFLPGLLVPLSCQPVKQHSVSVNAVK